MEIVKSNEGTIHETIRVNNLEGDMGEDEKLFLIQQADGDVIIGIQTPRQLYSVEFCTSNGGGRRPIIAKKLRELIAELAKDEVAF